MDISELKREFANCPCGMAHELNIEAVEAESGIVGSVGEILKKHTFPGKILLVADQNTLAAAEGLTGSLKGFSVSEKIYKDLRTADMKDVRLIEELSQDCGGILSVGTGSLHDICRLASARRGKKLALFATAPSMDGFASSSAPITDNNFKITYPAKCPEIIVADTGILANSPAELKRAGFGDMMGKYTGLIDWQVSNIISGEYCCEKVAALSRHAADSVMGMADKVALNDEECAKKLFWSLILTGAGMSFTNNSRPASGTEHILSHYWECMKLLEGELSDFHGKKVGVATLLILKEYNALASRRTVRAVRESVDWEDVYARYGPLADEVRKINSPKTVTDGIEPAVIERKWEQILRIIGSVPSYEEIRTAMERAGCATEAPEIGVSEELKLSGLKYHPYMRNRLSLMRLKNMIE